MSKFFAQIDQNNIIFAVSDSKPYGDSIECEGFDDIGKKYNATTKQFETLAKPVRYKIWSRNDFILSLGQAVFDAIVDGNDKAMRFAKYLLDGSPVVDINDPRYMALVDLLLAKKLITAKKMAEIKVLE